MQRKSVQKHLGPFLEERIKKIKKTKVGVNLMSKLNLYYHVHPC